MSQTLSTADARTDGLPGLQGKNVLVTGGSSGIGQAIAVRFAQYGANVAINYLREPEEARETEEQVHACIHKVRQEGVQDVLVGGDVSREEDVVRMVGEAVDGLGGIDILVNNAGIQISRPSEELSSADFDRVLAVNLRGSFMCAREAIRHFLADGKAGSIVNISSVHQLIPKPSYLGYSTSKGGMQNLTRTLALEYAGRGIRVNAVGPGATVTPINRAWIDDPVKRVQVEEHIPMRRAGDAGEMAGVTCFLASDLAAYITGQTIFVDGGLTLFPELLHAVVVGVSDEIGMLAHVDEAKRREALGLVREGRLYDLGHVLDEAVPVFPGRYFRQTLVTTAHHGNGGGLGDNQVNWITEQIAATQQLGTHIDALSHLQMGDRGYGGWTVAELAGTAGVTRLGVETVPQIVTRGWLVDATGVDVIGLEDVRGVDPAPGDAQTLNVEHGVFIVENLDTAALAADGVREFALILTHPKLRGATGAWTSPIALV